MVVELLTGRVALLSSRKLCLCLSIIIILLTELKESLGIGHDTIPQSPFIIPVWNNKEAAQFCFILVKMGTVILTAYPYPPFFYCIGKCLCQRESFYCLLRERRIDLIALIVTRCALFSFWLSTFSSECSIKC